MTRPDEWTAVAVKGWQVEWCRSIADARAHVLTLTELTRGHLDDLGRAMVAARVGRRLRESVAEYLDGNDLVLLGAAPIEESWTTGALVSRVRLIAIKRAPLPPVEDWPGLGPRSVPPSAVAP